MSCSLAVYGRRRPLGTSVDELAGVELPLLATAVEQLDGVVAVQLEVPVRVGREPVVVAAVEHDGVVVADALAGQQRLELGLVDEVAADRVLEVGLPVDAHGTADVVLLVGGGVLVDLDEDDRGSSRWASTQSASTRTSERLMWVVPSRVSGSEAVPPEEGRRRVRSGGGASAGAARRTSRYISQPRQNPNAALRKAARQRERDRGDAQHGGTGDEAERPDHGESQAHRLGEARRPDVLELARRRSRGRMKRLNASPYGRGLRPPGGTDREDDRLRGQEHGGRACCRRAAARRRGPRW